MNENVMKLHQKVRNKKSLHQFSEKYDTQQNF